MKNKLKIFLAFLTIFVVFKITNISALDNFEILDLDVTIDVNADGSYDITEYYKLNFFSPALGIYRDIPAIYHMDFNIDGKKVAKTYNFPIKNIKLVGDVYRVESELKGKRIVVGPDNGPRFTGEKEYVISYTVLSKPIDILDQKEGFFYNLVSGWSATMHNFSATVNFYKDVDMSSLNVKGSSYNVDFDVMCNVNNQKSFTCNYNDSVSLGKSGGITALVSLDDNYFKRNTTPLAYLPYLIISIFTVIYVAGIWVSFGKDEPIIKVVGFNPPNNFNSSMVGYAIDDLVDDKDIYSLLFSWANEGLIEINEKKKNKVQFRKLQEIGDHKVRFEKTLFKLLFDTDEYVDPQYWSKKQVYSKFPFLKKDIESEVERIAPMYTKESKKFSIVGFFISFVPIILYLNKVIFSETLNLMLGLIVSAIVFGFSTILYFIFYEAIKKSHKKRIFISSLFVVINTLVLSSSSFILTSQFGVTFNTMIKNITLITFSISLAYVLFMEKRTEIGRKVYGEILGFKDFINYAKKDELLMMQESNPSLYYDVLPYAYAFGLSSMWLKQFKEIEIPDSPYYTSYRPMGYSRYAYMNSMTNSFASVPLQSMPKFESGSGGGSFSSSGGGFSGGSFSGGGGFGGGGGGGR